MTKSIEEHAREFVKNKICFNGLEYSIGGKTYEECVLSYIVGAKARDVQWQAVVNELRSAVHCDYGCKTNQDHGWKVVKCNCGVEKSLTKADQMLRDMGVNL